VKRVVAVLPALVCASSGCRYVALDRATPQADAITDMHWVMFWVLGAVFFVVVTALAIALSRKARPPGPEGEGPRFTAVAAATGVTVAILLFLLVASVVTGRSVATPPEANALDIAITGHQWWWEVRYPAAIPVDEVLTANEIHVPVGRSVRLHLASTDVIHSFWAPNLDGKKDLIPGRATGLTFRVLRPGIYEGRCAEFCGLQHAHMGFRVFAQPPAEFEAWLASQRLPAVDPSDATLVHGHQVFLEGPCVTCHTIRGAGAFGRKAPDLTHLASRSTIAADTLLNTTGHLAGWIADPQRIKPGNRMPPNVLPSADLLDLVAYLQSLR
jgi:cytochrome c oxidase subunit II